MSQEKQSKLDKLYNELVSLKTEYKDYLQQEELVHDAECITQWIDSYRQGSQAAVEDLEEYGVKLLDNIHDKLKAAAADIQRVDGESPNAGNFSGGKADRLSKAAALAGQTEEDLEEFIEDEIHH